MKDHNISVLYYLRKVNVVADVVCQLLMGGIAYVEDSKKKLVHDIHRLALLRFVYCNESGVIF